jgi:hypothetical protein
MSIEEILLAAQPAPPSVSPVTNQASETHGL